MKAVFFDLDGTLTDSGEGIINCAILALEHFGLPIPSREALPMMLQQSFRTATPAGMMQLLDKLEQIMDRTNIYRLGCNMDQEAARVAYAGMQE